MQGSSTDTRGHRVLRIGAIAAAVALVPIGIGSVAKGLDGRSTVRDALTLEAVTGTPGMRPRASRPRPRRPG